MGLPKGPPEKKLTSRARRTFPCFFFRLLDYDSEDYVSQSWQRVTYGWSQPGREKAKKMGILPFMYWVLLTTYIFFALLEIVMCLKHIEASHIMAFDS